MPFWGAFKFTLEAASLATFWKLGAVLLTTAREPSSLTLEMAPEPLLGARATF